MGKTLSHNHKIMKSTIGIPRFAFGFAHAGGSNMTVVREPRLEPVAIKALIAHARTMVWTLMINLVMAMTTTGSRFSGYQTSNRFFQASRRLRGLARRSSALEHPGRSIAARAHDRNWHTFPLRCAAVIASGYRVTFVVRVWPAACLLMTQSCHR
jgi:hypothetical protein